MKKSRGVNIDQKDNLSEARQKTVESTLGQPSEKSVLSQKSSKKWLLPSLLGILIFALVVVSSLAYKYYWLYQQKSEIQPTPESIVTITPEQTYSKITSVEQSFVVFEKDDKIYSLDGINNEAAEIDEGNSPSLSNDQTKIAYIKMDKDQNIYVYDRLTKEKVIIETDEWRLRNVEWSPDGKYLVTDSGTYIKGSGALYEYPSGNKTTTFATPGGPTWLSNDEPNLSTEVYAILPQEYSENKMFGRPNRNDNFSNWVIINLITEGSIYNNLICIVDLNDPQNTFRQIAVGAYPEW